jgi:hypothetical protein
MNRVAFAGYVFACLLATGSRWLVVTACNGSVPPNVVQGGVASIETAICILNTFSKAKAAGKSDGDAVGACITECGADAAQIAKVLDAHRAAQIREGACK